MFITLKTLLHTLLLPPGGPLLLAAVGAGLIGRCRGAPARHTGWGLLIAGLSALWVLGTPLVSGVLNEAAQRYPALDLSRPVQAQAIVILGAGAARTDAPEYGGTAAAGAELLERVTYGAFVARRTHLPVLVSGQANEALAMRTSLARDFDVPTRWVEDRSRDTFQNAQFSARILKDAGVSRIILVTSAAHEWRATQEFVSAGFDVVPAPEGVASSRHAHGVRRYLPNAASLEVSSAALYELAGDLARRMFAALHLRQQTA